MSKHLRRPRRSRSRVVALGAAVLAAASVTTATVALGQAGGAAPGDMATAVNAQAPRTYACPGTALHVLRSTPSAVALTCSAGVDQVGRSQTFAARSGSTGSTTLPSGTAAGTVLVTTVLTPASSTVAMAGWTKAYDLASGANGLRLSAWYRTATTGERPPAATVRPAGRTSMITTAFDGAREADPVVAAAAGPRSAPAAAGSGVEGARRLTAVGIGVRHPGLTHARDSRTQVVVNGPTRLSQTVTAVRGTSPTPPPKQAAPTQTAPTQTKRAVTPRRPGGAVVGALTVLPRPPAAVPAGAIPVPVTGTTTATCDGTSLAVAVRSATVVTVTCAGPTPTTQPSPTTTATPTTSPTASTTTPTTTTSSTTRTSTTTSTTTSPPPTSTTTAPPPPAGRVCTSPVFRTSDPNGGWSEGGYYVHNNMWNIGKYPSLKETLEACSHASWNVTATADDSSHNGEVKTYPNVHVDYHGSGANGEPAWSSFKTLRSTFAAQGPGVGIYDVAYDIWMNGVPGNREIMIWTENHGQRPSGDVVGSVSVSGITWDVWATGDNGYLAFVPKAPVASGSLDLKAMIDYLVAHGRVPANSTLGQVCFGVEVVSTDAKPATFRFTDFSVTSS